MVPVHIQLETSILRKVLKRLHFPLENMLVRVRRHAAYPLRLRNLEEVMANRACARDALTPRSRRPCFDVSYGSANCQASFGWHHRSAAASGEFHDRCRQWRFH